MPTDWWFWLYLGSGAFGLLVIFYATKAKHNLRGKRLDKPTRLLITLLGASLVVVSMGGVLNTAGWRIPYDSAIKGILTLLAVSLIGLSSVIAVARRNHARAIAAQNMQDNQETNEEVG